MKMIAAIVSGIVASFGLTILGEYLVVNFMGNRFLELGVLFPLIALTVGVFVGLVIRNKTRVAAALSLAPWAVWLVFATNVPHSSVSRWATTVLVAAIYLVLGIGAAAFVAGRMAYSAARR